MFLLTNFGQTFVIAMLAVLLMVVLFGLVFFVNSLSQIKRSKLDQDEIVNKLEVGKRVALKNGIIGTIIAISDETIDLEVKSKAIVEVYKTAVHQIL
ncbi:MAG TPA: preprotein translocase subunit YajC [Erysipelothrix sp.]|jgi:preprotein translocase subunit YajC|nr:preprotein translocase subunit YajC [Erysipelothrix sp.]